MWNVRELVAATIGFEGIISATAVSCEYAGKISSSACGKEHHAPAPEIPIRLPQHVLDRGSERRVAVGTEFTAENALRPVPQSDFRHRLDCAAGGKPEQVDVTAAPEHDVRAVQAHRERAAALTPLRRGRGFAQTATLEPLFRSPQKATDFIEQKLGSE